MVSGLKATVGLKEVLFVEVSKMTILLFPMPQIMFASLSDKNIKPWDLQVMVMPAVTFLLLIPNHGGTPRIIAGAY